MGMSVGKSGGSDEPQVMGEMNTTPLIDVMLVLLVMLIITIPIQLHAVSMNMPVGTPPPKLVEPEIVKLDIDEKSQIYWNGEIMAIDKIEEKMRDAVAKSDQPEVHFRPNKSAKYDVVALVLASSQRTGLKKIGIVGSEQFMD
jgi:biopolymer transport protein ExbD